MILQPHDKLVDFLLRKISSIKNDKVAAALEVVVLYFNNLFDAVLGQTQGQVEALRNILDGVSTQILELMDENAKLKAELSKLKAKPTKAKKTTKKGK